MRKEKEMKKNLQFILVCSITAMLMMMAFAMINLINNADTIRDESISSYYGISIEEAHKLYR